MGAPLSSMGTSVPSRAISTVWLARPTMAPPWSTLATGFSTVRRVSSLTIRNTSSIGCPTASGPQPVRASATGFSIVIRPCGSVTITASPRLVSVVRKRSRSACTTSAARWRVARLRAKSQSTTATRPSPSASAITVEASAVRLATRACAARSSISSCSTTCIRPISSRIASMTRLPSPVSSACRADGTDRVRPGVASKSSMPRRMIAIRCAASCSTRRARAVWAGLSMIRSRTSASSDGSRVTAPR